MNVPKTLKTHDEGIQCDLMKTQTQDEGIQCELLRSEFQKVKMVDSETQYEQYEPEVESHTTYQRLNTFPSFMEPRVSSPLSTEERLRNLRKERASNDVKMQRYSKSLSLLKDQFEKNYGESFTFEAKYEEQLEVKCRNPNRIKDRHLRDLLRALNSELTHHDYSNFKIFYLDLEFCTQLTGDAFKELIEGPETNYFDLESLWLNFQGCTNLSPDKIKYLSQYLAENHQNLETLTLDFRLCTKIGDSFVKEIGNAIGNSLRNLKKVYLSFSDCNKITDESFEYLFSHVGKELKNLQVLSLKFNNCAAITNSSVDKLAHTFKDSPLRLTELILALMGTGVQGEDKDLLAKDLEKHVNKIYIV